MTAPDRPRDAKDTLLTVGLFALLVGTSFGFFYGDYFAPGVAGFTAFLLIPGAIGGLCSQLVDPQGKSQPIGCFVTPTLAILGIAAIAWLVLHEGAICILMILPIWLPAAIFGAAVRYWNGRRRRNFENAASRFFSVGWLGLPALLAAVEVQNLPQWQSENVTREIEISASAEKVWPLLASIPGIKPSEGRWNFTQDVLGVPRPSEARLVQRNGELVRLASWGNAIHFEERITRIESGRTIAWQFAFPDNSVQQYTDRHISPDGPVLRIGSGQYELQRLSAHSTKIRLTMQYQMRSRFGGYLAQWGELLFGDVETNVLEIVKHRVEATQ